MGNVRWRPSTAGGGFTGLEDGRVAFLGPFRLRYSDLGTEDHGRQLSSTGCLQVPTRGRKALRAAGGSCPIYFKALKRDSTGSCNPLFIAAVSTIRTKETSWMSLSTYGIYGESTLRMLFRYSSRTRKLISSPTSVHQFNPMYGPS